MRYGQAQAVGTKTGRAQKKLEKLFGLILIISVTPLFVLQSGCAGLVSGAKQTSSVGSFQITPLSVNFGQVAVGKQSTQVVSVSNTGNMGINLTKMMISDSHFTLTGMTTPMALGAGQSGSFTVAVNPTASGALTGTLTAQGDGGSTPVVVNLSATGIGSQPQLSLNPTAVSFGSVSTGLKATSNVMVTNAGAADLSISVVTLSGTEFAVSGITTPKTLTSGQSVQAAVTFSPTAAGSSTGSLTITSNDPTNPTTTVALSGSGTTAATGQLSANSTNVSFGAVATGSSVQKQIVLTNTGNAAVRISSITTTGAGVTSSGVTTPMTLNPSQSATLTASFAPTAAGSITGTITINSDASNSPLLVALSGTGAQAGLSISPASFNFGSVVDGQTKSQSITVTNTGTATLTISQLSAAGAGYSVSGLATPATVAAGGTATFNVLFAPTTAGSLGGTVSITSNAPNSPNVLPLSGTGAQAGLSISPASFNFGSVIDGQTKSQFITVTNTGTATLTIAQVSAAGAGYSVSGLATPATVAAGGTATFSVLFAPTTAGNLTGTVSITSNAPNSPNVLSLSGTGTAASVTISSNPASVSFTNVSAGSASSKSVTITNGGNTSVTLSQVAVNAKDFKASGITTPLTLAAGQNAAMSITFNPTTSESVSGNITVSSSQGSSAVISVSGSAVQPALTITPTIASFGNVTVGSPATQTIQLNNSGTSTLTITQVSVAGSGFSAGTLSLPLSLTSGQSANFNLQFSPTSAGAASGTASILSNAPNSPVTITLNGTGVAATQALSFSSTNLGFGNVTTQSSSTKTVTVTNTGNTDVTISQIQASGASFSLTGAGTPVTLTAGQNLTFGVVFSPTIAGNNIGTVTVTSTANGSPTTIALSGTGVPPATHSVDLTWIASTSTVSGYNVYRSTSNGAGYSKLNGSLVAGLAYQDTAVQSGTTYYYVVTAVDASTNESSDSNQATAVIP